MKPSFDDLFLQAREITDPSQRAAFLEEACAHQPDLRSRLEALLADASAADAYFSEPETVMGLEATPQARVAAAEVPELIGPYRILERLGQGGMGDVYRAVQKEPIRREVALKLVKAGLDTAQVIARFEAERQALALRDHPHIARVLDAGADSLGRPYFVMELVRGVPVTEYADEKQLTLRQRLELMQQICQAIQHAHSKGVIHRDLKPSNILVSTQDGKPHAKVIDFGIAKATAQPLTDKTFFTHFQQFIGTPAYMSPEQAEGSLDIDTRSDVYALGILLYELLTGDTPVDAATLKKAALHEIARLIKEHEPLSPSTRLLSADAARKPARSAGRATGGDPPATTELQRLAGLRATTPEVLVKTVRGELDWMVMKALEKDRSRRYETPASLSDDIRHYLEGLPVVAAPQSAAYRMRKFVRKHRAPVLAAAALVTLMTAGILGTGWGLVREKAANEKAVQQARLAEEARDEARAESRRAETEKARAETKQTEAEAGKAAAIREREAAELEAYIGNLAAAQAALNAHDYPEARRRLAVCPERLRGWEWSFLSEKAKSVVCMFPPHLIPLHFRPDGQSILVWDQYETCLRLHDLEGNRAGPDIRGPAAHGLEGVKFTPDGKKIISVSIFDHLLEVWDVETAKCLWKTDLLAGTNRDSLNSDTEAIVSLDGQYLVVKSIPRIYHIDGGYCDLDVGEDFWVDSIAFLPNSPAVITHHDGEARFWNLKGKPAEPQALQDSSIFDLALSADGERILTRSKTGLRIWDKGGKLLSTPVKGWATGFATMPDGKLVAHKDNREGFVLSRDGHVLNAFYFHRLDAGTSSFSSQSAINPPRDKVWLQFSPDSKNLCISFIHPAKGYGRNDAVLIPDMDNVSPRDIQVQGNWGSGCVCFTPDSKYLLRSDKTTLSLLTLNGLQACSTLDFNLNTAMATGIEFSSDQRTFLMAQSLDGGQHDSATTTDGWPILDFQSMDSPVYKILLRDIVKELHWVSAEKRFQDITEQVDLRVASLTDEDLPLRAKSDIKLIQDKAGGTTLQWQTTESGKIETRAIQIRESVSAACLHPDQMRLFAAKVRHLIVWDLISQREVARMAIKQPAKSLSSHRQGSQIVIRYIDDSAEVWDSRPASERRRTTEPTADQMAQAKDLAAAILKQDLDQGLLSWKGPAESSELADGLLRRTDVQALCLKVALDELNFRLGQRRQECLHARNRWKFRRHKQPALDQQLRRAGVLTSDDSQAAFNLDRKVKPTTDELLDFLLAKKEPRITAEFQEEIDAALSLLPAADRPIVTALMRQVQSSAEEHDTIRLADACAVPTLSPELLSYLAREHAIAGQLGLASSALKTLINGHDSVALSDDIIFKDQDLFFFESKGLVIKASPDFKPTGTIRKISSYMTYVNVNETLKILQPSAKVP